MTLTMMALSVFALIQALSFTITPSQNNNHVTLRYPVTDGVDWVSVCVEVWGVDENPRENVDWYMDSCWEPKRRAEQLSLKPGAMWIRGHLQISENSVRSVIHTRMIQIRPEPE